MLTLGIKPWTYWWKPSPIQCFLSLLLTQVFILFPDVAWCKDISHSSVTTRKTFDGELQIIETQSQCLNGFIVGYIVQLKSSQRKLWSPKCFCVWRGFGTKEAQSIGSLSWNPAYVFERPVKVVQWLMFWPLTLAVRILSPVSACEVVHGFCPPGTPAFLHSKTTEVPGNVWRTCLHERHLRLKSKRTVTAGFTFYSCKGNSQIASGSEGKEHICV